jgi:hypothetical protein
MMQHTQIFLTNHTCVFFLQNHITIVYLHNFTPTLTCPKLYTYTLHMMCTYFWNTLTLWLNWYIKKPYTHTNKDWYEHNIIISSPLPDQVATVIPGWYVLQWVYYSYQYGNPRLESMYTGPELIPFLVGRGISTGPKWWYKKDPSEKLRTN